MIINNWINLVSNSFGFIGTVLIFKYGIPNKIDMGGHSAIVVSPADPNEIVQIKKFKRFSQIGLAMISFSFLIQMISSLY